MDAKTKTAEEMVADTPFVASLLLMMFERDALALSDYLTRSEQDKKLSDVQYGVRNKLLIDRNWTLEAATALAKSYRESLVMRLTKPTYFKTASHI